MREFFTVEYNFVPESGESYQAIVRLWIKTDTEEKLPKGYLSPKVTLMGEKLHPNWGIKQLWEDIPYRMKEVVLTSDCDWEVVILLKDYLFRISTYILHQVTTSNLAKQRSMPNTIVREVFFDEDPF